MAENKAGAASEGQITLDVAGRLLMVSAEWVRRLINDGYIEKVAPGRVTIVGAVQGYIRYLKDEERKNTKTASASRAQDARAAEIELRIAERKRELIPLEDAIAAIDHVVGRVNDELGGLPARVTRDIEQRRKIETEVDEAKTRIAKSLAEAAGFARTGSGLSDADTQD